MSGYLIHKQRSRSKYKGGFINGKNTSEYNHDYYIHNKDKWGMKKTYTEGDSDFDDRNYKEENRIGDTNFFLYTRPDGSQVLLEEDMKWEVPKGATKADIIKFVESTYKEYDNSLTPRQRKERRDFNKSIWGDKGNAYLDTNFSKYEGVRSNKKRKIVRHSSINPYSYRIYSDELYHDDIKGQKWGRRNYQNPDGSYTEEGRRYGIGEKRKAYRKAMRKSKMR